MAAAITDRQTPILANGGMRSGRRELAAAVIVYYGTMIALDAAGYVVRASDAAALKVIGIAQETVDNTAGAAGAKSVSYVTACTAEFDNLAGAIVQASAGRLCYVGDDSSVTTAAVALNDIVVGTVTKFSATKVLVYIDERVNV